MNGNTFLDSISNTFKKGYNNISSLFDNSTTQQPRLNPNTVRQTLLANTQANSLPDFAKGQSTYTPREAPKVPNATGLDGNPTYITNGATVTSPTFKTTLPSSDSSFTFGKGSWLDKANWATKTDSPWLQVINDPNATPYQKAVAQANINQAYEDANKGLFTNSNGEFSFKNTMGTLGAGLQAGQAIASVFDSFNNYRAMKDNLKTAKLQREVMQHNLDMSRQEYARLQNQRRNYSNAYMGGR